MKKKLIIATAALLVLAVLGTGVYAATEDSGFLERLPFMKQMHPDLTDEQLEEMYNTCHSNGTQPSGMRYGRMGMMGNGRGFAAPSVN